MEHPTRTSKITKRDISPSRNKHTENTPLKRQKISQPGEPVIADPQDSPRSAQGTPAQLRTCIGPTPQKDGRVLGLFDLLSPAPNSHKTPTKRTSLGGLCPNALETPTKPKLIHGDEQEVSRISTAKKLPRSPISASKRTYLNTFLTPSALRMVRQCTPRSKSKHIGLPSDETPAFLRRDSQRAWLEQQSQADSIDEADKPVSWSPLAVRRRPKLAARGLSMLVKGLRDMEDERLDEDLALMREIESEVHEPTGSTAMAKQPKPIVEDSQVLDMPLGPDGAGSSEDEVNDLDDEDKTRDGKQVKVWRKKGQKRTTRKTNIKPSKAKWKPEPTWKADVEVDATVDEPALIEETQIANKAAVADSGLPADESDDMDYLDDGVKSEVDGQEAVKAKSRPPNPPARSNDKGVRKTKKINPTAHANFRALKIKNKNSKAKRGGRFGRARR